MLTVETATELRALLKRYLDAQAASTRGQDARARLQAGSTRARSTTANANWARAAEHRDRCRDTAETRLCELVRPPVVDAIRRAGEKLNGTRGTDIESARDALLDALGHLRQLGGL
jgi:hypothetical protein